MECRKFSKPKIISKKKNGSGLNVPSIALYKVYLEASNVVVFPLTNNKSYERCLEVIKHYVLKDINQNVT